LCLSRSSTSDAVCVDEMHQLLLQSPAGSNTIKQGGMESQTCLLWSSHQPSALTFARRYWHHTHTPHMIILQLYCSYLNVCVFSCLSSLKKNLWCSHVYVFVCKA
jgi:hypothetical protein